jgi:hypothetical protein
MKITNVYMENFKKITFAEFIPDGNMVVLSGANGQGKTCLLNGIWAAIGGRAASSAIDTPVKNGADEAIVRVTLDDLIVTRKWKNDKTTLTVESADGAKYGSPQSVLDSFVGRLTFDPLAFTTMPPKEQVKTLLGLVTLPFDPEQLAADRKTAFDERTAFTRARKEVDAQLDGLPPVPAGTPDEFVSASDLLAQIEQATALATKIDAANADVTTAKLKVERLTEELENAHTEARRAIEHAASAPPVPDVEALKAQLATTDTINTNVRAKQAAAELTAKRDRLAASEAERTETITALDKTKTDGLAAANFPIKGLAFDDDGVTFNDVPFSSASSGERLRVSTIMGMAMNPKLRIMYLRDASLLDSKNLATLEATAKLNDFQLWIERVDESGTVGIVLEDGLVKQS